MGVHQGSVLSPFIFAMVVDIATKFAIEGTCEVKHGPSKKVRLEFYEG